ncbi:MAG: hypothetical protein ACD_6C00769G0008 [uncultured bacterium]|nr:MAG: hypothetical protein ACD_6C00769G0008 [uncultured bacterium]HCB29494.1 hypothetical protein [Acinetobacter lwoffii]
MLDAYFNYQYTNLVGFLIFMSLGWLAYKTDIAKDFLALLLVLLLTIPVPLVMTVHYENESWFSLIFCGLIQAGLFYLCFIFLKYMYEYHRKNKYIFWE